MERTDLELTQREIAKRGAARGRRPRRRRLYWGLGVVAGVVLLLYFVAPMVVTPILRERLQRMVSAHLNADLTMDGLSYHFPYGLSAHNAALVARDERGERVDLLRVKELDLHLAKLPLGKGPLVFKRVIIKEPSARLIVNDNGLVGARALLRSELDQTTWIEMPDGERRPARPSDYFRLRRFEIQGGQIVYEDRRGGQTRPPVVWKNLQLGLDTTPSSGSLYAYDLSAKNAPLAQLNAHGGFDVDTLRLDVERFVLGLQVERGKRQEQLPPEWQEILRRYEVAGSLTFSGSATVPLRNREASTYQAMVELPTGSARIGEGPGRVDRLALRVRLSSGDQAQADREVTRPVVLSDTAVAATQPSTRAVALAPAVTQPPTVVHLDLLDVGAPGASFHVEKGVATIDPASGQWRVTDLLCRLELGTDRSGLPTRVEELLNKFELSGKVRMTATAAGPLRPASGARVMDQVDYQVIAYPRDVVVKSPKWQTPFTGISGTVRANRDTIVVENVEARFHDDKFFVTGARIPIADIDKELRIHEIVGSAQLTGNVTDYGKPFEFLAREVRPAGTFFVLGSFARRKGLKPGERPEFHFDIRSDDAAATLGKKQIPVTELKSEVVATDQLIDFKRLDGNVLGGSVTGDGQIVPGKGTAMLYQGNVWVRDVDLKALGELLAAQSHKPSRLSGKGNANARVEGTGSDVPGRGLDFFKAEGQFEVLEGDFWSLPALDEVARGAKVSNDALTVGQAAGTFKVHDKTVELTNAALSSPVLGVQGSGTVGFDGAMDLRVVAAPLADWKDQIKRTKIPILSDVAGEVFGGLQKMINTATKTLLYEFRVTGTARRPKVDAVPAPVLSDGLAKVFGGMVKGQKLSDVVGVTTGRPGK